MKKTVKVLSVILILAALFGLAGGGLSLKDVSECKAYWEFEYDEAIANLTKLEDGLNMLSENEAAYLEGRETYEAGLLEYEAGKEKLAAGQAQYDQGAQTLREKQGEFDAGTLKLQAAEAQLAAGKAELDANKAAYEAGKKQLAAYEDRYPAAKAFVDSGAGRGDYEAVNAIAQGSTDSGTVTNAAVEAAKAELIPQITEQVKAEHQEALIAKYKEEYASTTAQLAMFVKVSAELRPSVTEQVRNQCAEQIMAEKGAAYTETATSAYCLFNMKSRDELTDEDLANIQTNVNNQVWAEALLVAPAQIEQELSAQAKAETERRITEQVTAAVTKEITEMVAAEAQKQVPARAAQMGQAYSSYVLVSTYEAGQAKIAQYEQGLAAYEAGLREYNAGKAALASGASQLSEGKKTLETAGATLSAGRKSLSAAERQLADGKAKLDEFEAGRDQIIDGLETLKATETHAGLVSIADRLGADFNYMKNDTDLDIAEGLRAVQVAREFTEDNVAAVTKELTTRAAAAVLALLGSALSIAAGIFGLLGRRKAAGVLSVPAALAAGAAAAAALIAGTELSIVAGSTLAALALVSGGILAAAAAAHAIGFLAPVRTDAAKAAV